MEPRKESEIQGNTLNFNTYRKFWSIQKFLQNPLGIFVDEEPENESNIILFKEEENFMEIEDISNNNTKIVKNNEKEVINVKNQRFNKFFENVFNILEIFQANPIIFDITDNIAFKKFPRFLTNSSLLDTQFKDPNFRKIWLTQLLLAIYSLKNPIKIAPQKNYILLADQVKNKIFFKISKNMFNL